MSDQGREKPREPPAAVAHGDPDVLVPRAELALHAVVGRSQVDAGAAAVHGVFDRADDDLVPELKLFRYLAIQSDHQALELGAPLHRQAECDRPASLRDREHPRGIDLSQRREGPVRQRVGVRASLARAFTPR